MYLSLALAASAGCSKDDQKAAGAPAPVAQNGKTGTDTPDSDKTGGDANADAAALAVTIGIEAGGITPDADEGPEAIAAAEGEVEIRRVGTETFAAAEGDINLYPGDQIRTDEGAAATVTFSDTTVVELAELSAVAVGDRNATADPASSAAVLYGVARFSVSERVPGEGAFIVYTPTAVVATVGTIYAVGVSASAEVKVGVESGEVAVASLVEPTVATTVTGGTATTINTAGEMEVEAEFAADSWGEWRDQSEAELDVAAVADAHVTAMADLNARLTVAAADLNTAIEATAAATAEAETAAAAEDKAAYEGVTEDLGANIEVSFYASARMQHLAYANLARAYLTSELYVRHPETVKPAYIRGNAHVAGAILWHKKFHVAAYGDVAPIRAHYYIHHPQGRANAAFANVSVPAFYGNVKLRPVAAAKVRAKIQTPIFVAPAVKAKGKAKGRVVLIGKPAMNWRGKVKVRAAKPKSGAFWYVKAQAPKAKAFVGANVTGTLDLSFVTMAAPMARADASAALHGAPGWSGSVKGHAKGNAKAGAHGKAAVESAADGKAAAHGTIKLGSEGAAAVHEVGAKAVEDVKAGVKAGAKVTGSVKANIKGAGVSAAQKSADAKAKAKADAKIKADAKAKADAKVKADVKIKKPKVPTLKGKIDVKAEGGLKLGQ